jgi:hypothetical protein
LDFSPRNYILVIHFGTLFRKRLSENKLTEEEYQVNQSPLLTRYTSKLDCVDNSGVSVSKLLARSLNLRLTVGALSGILFDARADEEE